MTDNLKIKTITAQEVEAWEIHAPAREIINGEWAKESEVAGKQHGRLCKKVTRILDDFVVAHGLGEVYPDNVNYVLEGTPGNVIVMRIPDVSFVRAERVDELDPGFYYLAPDLAIEVVSPSEKQSDTDDKVTDYLHYGALQVWVIYPAERRLSVHLPDGSTVVYSETDTVEAPDLLPGFKLLVKDVLPEV